jgi:hypothetical protein
MPREHLIKREIAKKIVECINLVSDATGPCGNNPLFYNEIARELKKMKPYNIGKLHDILNVAMVLERLN